MNLTTKLALVIQKRLNAYLQTQSSTIRKALWTVASAQTVASFPESKREFAKVLFKNQFEYFQSASNAQPYTVPEFEITNKEAFILNMLRHYLTELNVHYLVGVQPMQGPVGLVYGMRFHEGEKGQDGGKHLRLEVVSQAVEASTKKCQAGWTIEAMQDIKTQHNLDVEDEMAQVLGHELSHETTSEILNDLLRNAAHVSEFTPAKSDPETGQHLYVEDRIAGLLTRINQTASEIARTTRRGAGNYIVVSPVVLCLLQSLRHAKFVPTTDKIPYSSTLSHVGVITAGEEQAPLYKVYSTLCGLSDGDTDTILVGYKGGNGEIDTGYVFSPYIPVMPSGVVINPVTFQPAMSLMTRYGKTFFKMPEGYLPADGTPYYGKITLNGLAFA